MTKAELRKIYLAQQKSLSSVERKQKSEQIAERLFRAFDFRRVDFLHCFLPIEKFGEIDTRIIFERVWCEFPNVKTVLPRVNFATHEIENVRFTAETKLVQNQWQIKEPVSGELVEAKRLEMALVPLLGFDENGFRVGYGKGFYDRLLQKCQAECLKIGLSYFEPIEEIWDLENFDVRMDFTVTPTRVCRTCDGI